MKKIYILLAWCLWCVQAHAQSCSVNAGTDKTVCGNSNVSMGASAGTGVTSYRWTSTGSGSFSPANNVLNPVYIPSVADYGTTVVVTLKGYRSAQGDSCTDNANITVTSPPVVDAGPNKEICLYNTSVVLSGTRTNATGQIWSTTGSGSFSPSSTSTLTPTYNSSGADQTNGSVKIYLTSTGNGVCAAAKDSMIISINSATTYLDAFANTPNGQTICAGSYNTINLSASRSGGSGQLWSTSGTGTFSSTTAANPTYTLSPTDKNLAQIVFRLVSTGNGTCGPQVKDSVVLTVVNKSVNAGSSQTVCANTPSVSLVGTSSNVTNVIWSRVNATGIISPFNTLAATYTPSADDRAAGSVILRLSSQDGGQCQDVSDTMKVTFQTVPVVDAGANQVTCASDTLNLSGTVTGATGAVWSSLGTGTFISTSSLTTKYILSAADRAAGSVIIRLTSTGNGACSAVRDSMIITIAAATMDAGPNQTVCATATSINLSGSRVGSTGQVWTTSGNGTFSSTTVLNPTYTFSAGDKAAGKVTLYITSTGNVGCPAGKDSVVITFQAAPVVDAGANQSGCTTMTGLGLSGTFANCGGMTWTTNGTGTLIINSAISASYTLSAADKVVGSVIFRVTSTGNGVCAAATDSMILTLPPPPTINAGADKYLCTSATNVSLSATKTGSSTGQSWSASGTGTYSPGSTSLNTTYTFTAADKTAGFVRFIVSTTGNGGCGPGRDTVMVYFSTGTADAGPDQSLCGDSLKIQLSGSVTGATGGTWTSNGTGTFIPNNTTLNAQYAPSAADYATGSVTLTLTSTGGTCAATDNVVFTIGKPAHVSAGSDQTLCTSQSTVALSGSRTGGTGQTWTSSGSGSFSSGNTVLSPTYIFSVADKAAGFVRFIITSTGNGICPAAKDTMMVYFINASANAGPDQTLCGDSLKIQLNGSVTNATGGTWSTLGTGTFIPNTTTLNAQYVPSAADYAAGSVTLSLTVTGTICTATDNVTFTIGKPAHVFAGYDQNICTSENSVNLSGSRTGGTGQVWTSSGTGTFSSTTAFYPTYTFSATDKVSGYVRFILTSTGNGICPAAKDTAFVYFSNPTVNAGPDQSICQDSAIIQLNGSVTNAAGAIWTKTGTGTFIPNDSTLNAVYYPAEYDYAIGTVKFILTSFGGACFASDTMTLSLARPVEVNAGPDQSFCAELDSFNITGYAANNSSVLWTSSGTGYFTYQNYTYTTYHPSPADKAAGSVWLKLAATGQGICPGKSDSLLVSLVLCQDTCISSINSFSDSLSGKSLYVSATVNPYKTGTYQWNFGDGAIQYGQYASHTYASPGTYIVCVNFVSSDNLCHLQYCKTIKVSKCYVSVYFTKSVSQDTAYFTANTTPATPGEYFWNFGDGVISKGQNVMHVYATSGTYPVGVSFYSTDNTCVCEAVFVDSVRIKTCPKIYFNQTMEGSTVTLTAISNTATTGTYYWDFGDGTFGTGAVVTHTYSSLGTYPVLLEFFSHNGTCQCLCHSEFTKNVKISNCNLDAFFTGTVTQKTATLQSWNTNPSNVYYWNFGDGLTQTTTNYLINHHYSNAGNYLVTLTIRNHSNPLDTCEASWSDSILVEEVFAMFKSPSVSLHPNPATETLNYKLDIEEPVLAESVEIVNGMGTVAESQLNVTLDPEGNTFDISRLSPGLYVIKINSAGTIYSKQFLKN